MVTKIKEIPGVNDRFKVEIYMINENYMLFREYIKEEDARRGTSYWIVSGEITVGVKDIAALAGELSESF